MSKFVAVILAFIFAIAVVIASVCLVSADSGGTTPLVPLIPFNVELTGDEDAVIACPTAYYALGGTSYYHTTLERFPIDVGMTFESQPNVPYASGQYNLHVVPPSGLNVTDVRIYADDVPFFLFDSWQDAIEIETNLPFSGTVTVRSLSGEYYSWMWEHAVGVDPQKQTLLGGTPWEELTSRFGSGAPVWVSFDISYSTDTVPIICYYGGNPEIVSAQIQGAFSGALVDAHDAGYSEGFTDGSSGDWFGGLGGSVGAFLEMELLPNFSFANVLFVVIGLGILAFVLKLLFV